MRTRIGFDHYTIAHRGFTARQTLEFAQAHHFDGVQFLEPASIDAGARRTPAGRSFADRARRWGFISRSGCRRRTRSAAPASWAAWSTLPSWPSELVPHVEAVAALVAAATPASYVGDRHDRFRADSPWATRSTATIEVIERLTPRLKDLGIRLAIETHADLTGDELMAVLTGSIRRSRG